MQHQPPTAALPTAAAAEEEAADGVEVHSLTFALFPKGTPVLVEAPQVTCT